MKATVDQGITGRAVGEDVQHQEVFNNEVIPVLKSVREAVNFTHRYAVATDTADSIGAYKTIWESETPQDGSSGLVWAQVIGINAAGETTGAHKYLGYKMLAGVLTLTASAGTVSWEDNVAYDIRLQISGTVIQLQVLDTGVAANFTAVVEVLELTR